MSVVTNGIFMRDGVSANTFNQAPNGDIAPLLQHRGGGYTGNIVPDLTKSANSDYVDRVNRAIDYVTRNLDQPLRLEEVARAACFSSYHFHRIFRSLMGETLAAFVKRVRLERAIYLLSHRNGASLTDIALACGFSSSSDFSRSFRGQYGMPPSRFDVEQFRLSGRKALEVASTPPGERHLLKRLPAGKNPDGFVVNLRDRKSVV